ncbi:Alpha/Beta hydrolase protein [Mycena metata]|uniref:Alpha/Beta hydrolase protein n=1 Tax=Mycena metata TaxID=1033252 RepID=A0AAD7JK55_9AGAR|nr:Alpha/Beta hydrolase protein [Mycena metata]
MSTTPRKYGELPWYHLLTMLASLAPLPLILVWTALVTSHASHNKGKSLRRILGERTLRYAARHTSVAQQQFVFGTTVTTYKRWSKQMKLDPIVDELGEDAHLMWIGPKRTDRVLFLCHGGCYFLPVTDFLLAFWQYVQLELKKQNVEIGIALLSYSLAPMAKFPTPAKQATLALQFLLDAGVQPGNLYLGGDSAGGNLLLQVVSNMLHPHTGVPQIRRTGGFRSLGLFSPWASFTTDTKSFQEFDGIDFLDRRILGAYGSELLEGYSEGDRAFAEPAKAPQDWFEGVGELVDHIFITAGEREVMHDDIVNVAQGLKKHHTNVELVVQEGGVHDDMFIDFFTREKKLSSLTPKVITWLATQEAALTYGDQFYFL